MGSTSLPNGFGVGTPASSAEEASSGTPAPSGPGAASVLLGYLLKNPEQLLMCYTPVYSGGELVGIEQNSPPAYLESADSSSSPPPNTPVEPIEPTTWSCIQADFKAMGNPTSQSNPKQLTAPAGLLLTALIKAAEMAVVLDTLQAMRQQAAKFADTQQQNQEDTQRLNDDISKQQTKADALKHEIVERLGEHQLLLKAE